MKINIIIQLINFQIYIINNTNDKNNRKMLINTNSYNIKINTFIL